MNCRADAAPNTRQIAENITGFFAILAEWTRAETLVPADHLGVTGTSEDGEVRHDC